MLIFYILNCLFHWSIYKIKLKVCLVHLSNMIKMGKSMNTLKNITVPDDSAIRLIYGKESRKWKNMWLEINQLNTFRSLGKLYNLPES